MACVLCRLLCDRFQPAGGGRDAFWDVVHDWEDRFAVGWEPQPKGEEMRAHEKSVGQLLDTDPGKAIGELAVLSERGSAWAARTLGYLYSEGVGCEQDLGLAEEYYDKAVQEGSWLGTLELAQLLFDHSISNRWEAILVEGHERGFLPSTFQLVRYRYRRAATRSTARQQRPLLEKAAEAGHPAARALLARWKFTGKFGIGEIRDGLREAAWTYEQATKCEGGEVSRGPRSLDPVA